MSIFPLPQFEADLKAYEEDRAAYDRLKAPTSIVVRFGAMRLVGEFPYSGTAKPGCGSKLVVRTHRGTELGEMLTSTCPNAGCSKSVSRKEMLEYIENSGGRDYPFFDQGRVLRIATVEDLNTQAKLDAEKQGLLMRARAVVGEFGLDMKLVEAEPILGGERLSFYFLAEGRIDFRELVARLAQEFSARIELRQIGARDEARLTADYERCGQHCCCKQFLKVLKPVSMRSAKTQKATLDPLKISGRCGRLMCCLRYEDATYEELKKRLPRRKSTVMTPDGPGTVLDTQILTQLVRVRLDATGEEIAVTVEELGGDGSDPVKVAARKAAREKRESRRRRPDPTPDPFAETADKEAPDAEAPDDSDHAGSVGGDIATGDSAAPDQGQKPKRRRRRRSKRGGGRGQGGEGGSGGGETDAQGEGGDAPRADRPQPRSPQGDGPPAEGEGPRRAKKRRRRRRRGGGGGSAGAAGEGGGGGGPGDSGGGGGG